MAMDKEKNKTYWHYKSKGYVRRDLWLLLECWGALEQEAYKASRQLNQRPSVMRELQNIVSKELRHRGYDIPESRD